MKVLQSSIFRAVIAIAVGVLLVQYREETMTWMTRAIGILFFMSGLISCVVYYTERKRIAEAPLTVTQDGKEVRPKSPIFPVVGVGSIVLGFILALLTQKFIIYSMYVLGILLVLGAVNQFFSLARALKYSHVPFIFWLFPTVLLLASVFIFRKPLRAASDVLLPIGWCFMFYGVVECVNTLKIYMLRRAFEKTQAADIEDAIIVSSSDNAAAVDTDDGIEDAVIIEDEG